MKICFIAPGLIEIPPLAWGALENVVHYQSSELAKLGYTVKVINEADPNKVLSSLYEFDPDIVHLHYGAHYELMPHISCRKIVTNHDGSFKFSTAFHDMTIRKYLYDCEFFCLSQFEKNFFIQLGIAPKKIKIMPNGVESSMFRHSYDPKLPTRSICVGKVDSRKRQAALQKMDLDIDFVGDVNCPEFDQESPTHLGLWTRNDIYNKLTDYANLVLLSSSENCCPLVCLEAMSAGLGIVISEACTEGVDLSLPFITVIPENMINDKRYVGSAIEENKITSLSMRKEIIEYGFTRDWPNAIQTYVTNLK